MLGRCHRMLHNPRESLPNYYPDYRLLRSHYCGKRSQEQDVPLQENIRVSKNILTERICVSGESFCMLHSSPDEFKNSGLPQLTLPSTILILSPSVQIRYDQLQVHFNIGSHCGVSKDHLQELSGMPNYPGVELTDLYCK